MVGCAYEKRGSHLLLDEDTGDSSCQRSRGTNNKDDQDGKTSTVQSFMHIIKGNLGTGILAFPAAFRHVGLLFGLILVPIIGAICIHCIHILVSTQNYLCNKFNYESLDYDQVAALGLACGPKFARRLAKYAHIVVTAFLIFTQVGFCCVYIMFVVENLQTACLNLFQVQYSIVTYLLLVFPIIGLTSCSSNLKYLARISTLANILQLTGLALIFYDLLQFHTYGNSYQDQTSSSANATSIQVHQFISKDIVNGLPLFFATAVYAFEGIGLVLPLLKEMQYPEHLSGINGVLNTSMSIIAILYMGMGFFGYAKYGQFVQGSITLNLPQTTLNEMVRIIFAVAIGLSYSLQFYVPWTIIWPFIDESLFYSYRPRESRDKLDILNKLSAENEWAIEESDIWQQQQQQTGSRRPSVSASSRQVAFNTSIDHHQQRADLQNQMSEQMSLDANSNASTFATSYAVSNSYQLQPSRSLTRRNMNLSTSLASASATINYGSTKARASPIGVLDLGGRQRNSTGCGVRRNRLEDVMEQEDSLPEVQWRPPPRSMRGKRKLVRYTVILLSVSFTCK